MTDAELVVEAVKRELGPQDDWKRPRGYPDSLALCVIDSVFSLRSRYSAVENVVATYREARVAQGGLADTDGAAELLTAIEAAGGAEGASALLFRNRGLAPGTRELKASAVTNGARALLEAGVFTAADLRTELIASAAVAPKAAWLSVAGLGPASWAYLGMLTGADGVKGDTWIVRFVSRAVGERSQPQRASRAVEEAARILRVPATLLDHRIWSHERGRRA
ncbi:hypothetical protein [Actinotalea sp. K2]|uniref:hypothetical protein n=1 Tax=Actinotalea sp. K2 TaxID=2939438 RepID=UPI0020183938|nr:hypothetical protein [Actinotalea sp. K2]MCL3862964.1 hypothetical protein [Actinotalea sp. K2]